MEIAVDNPKCPACDQPVGDVWIVTKPKVHVICGSAACERWAAAQGLWIWTDSVRWRSPFAARRRRPRPTLRVERATYLPSPDVIDNARSAGGGWSQSTLAAWGVPWPPPEGWRADLERRWRERH